MERIHYIVDFVFDDTQKLLMKVFATWQGKPVALNLSGFLTFLYQNEAELDRKDTDFSYSLAKWLKKITVGFDTIEAICDDWDMAFFFKKAIDQDLLLFWNNGTTFEPIQKNTTLPITVCIKQVKSKLVCTMDQREEWLENPFNWLTFTADKDIFCFSNGVLLHNPQSSLLDFLDQFLDQPEVIYPIEEARFFLEKIYQLNKNDIFWDIYADLSDFLPQEIEPIAHLQLTFQEGVLTPALSYKYQEVLIGSDYRQDTIVDPRTGKNYLRMPELENIYQQDLMQIFMERNLPFLLQNPADIATFMQKVVPVLKSREWEIESNVEEFVVHDKPVELEFTIQSQSDSIMRDWFYFEPNVVIGDQKLSCQELARLMIQNQGYIKTKTGYIPISETSQKSLRFLSQMNAFNPQQKFNAAQILPLIAMSSVAGGNVHTKQFITQFNGTDPSGTCLPGVDFKGALRDYQQHGVNWMNFLYRAGLGGILADDMGLGKTVQTLAFCSQLESDAPILIIGPTNVIFNWEREIQKFLPGTKSLVYTGANRWKNLEEIHDVRFLITSFGVLKNDIDWLKSVSFEAIFVDEAQFIKNPQAQISKAVKELNARFRIAMTGTPVENHLMDLWNLFDFVMPKFLGNQRTFDLEIKDGNLEFIKTKIKPFVLRRVKQEVLSSLPEKTEIIITCEMSEAQTMLYKTVLDAVRMGIRNSTGQKERMNILTSLLRLRQVCVHPNLLPELQTQNLESTKFEVLKEKILDLVDEGHKVTIFTQFTGMLDILNKWVNDEEIYYERIDGSVSGRNRMEAVERFQSAPQAGVFMISLKAGGVGLNLTAADYVIHLDPWWNPAIESQATDRVHRIGQQNKVIVYKMITKGTIEEKIQELQEEKRQLLAQIIDDDSQTEKIIDIQALKSLVFE